MFSKGEDYKIKDRFISHEDKPQEMAFLGSTQNCNVYSLNGDRYFVVNHRDFMEIVAKAPDNRYDKLIISDEEIDRPEEPLNVGKKISFLDAFKYKNFTYVGGTGKDDPVFILDDIRYFTHINTDDCTLDVVAAAKGENFDYMIKEIPLSQSSREIIFSYIKKNSKVSIR